MENNSNLNKREYCPVCNSTNTSTLYSIEYNSDTLKKYLTLFYSNQGYIDLDLLDGGMYQIEECMFCGLIFQKFFPNDILLKEIYTVWIDPKISQKNRFQEILVTNYQKEYVKELMQMKKIFSNPTKQIQIYDFGMGWGEYLAIAKAIGFNCHGSEIEPTRVANAKKMGINIVDLQKNNIKFDVIIAEQVFEHLTKPRETLIMLRNALKKDGIIKISVPHSRNIRRITNTPDWEAAKGSKMSINPLAPLEHLQYFNRRSLIILAKECCLKEYQLNLKNKLNYSYDWFTIRGFIRNIYSITPFTKLNQNIIYLCEAD